MVVHPTGKYAYLLRQYNERNGYISRMDYNSTTDQFSTPLYRGGKCEVEAVIVTE